MNGIVILLVPEAPNLAVFLDSSSLAHHHVQGRSPGIHPLLSFIFTLPPAQSRLLSSLVWTFATFSFWSPGTYANPSRTPCPFLHGVLHSRNFTTHFFCDLWIAILFLCCMLHEGRDCLFWLVLFFSVL